MNEILMNIAVEAPSATVAIYALWRMSVVMLKLADALTAISTNNSENLSDIIESETNKTSNGHMNLLRPNIS